VPTYHRWKEQYGGADRNAVERLKELKHENSRLKKLVADQALDNAMLKELVEGKVVSPARKREATRARWSASSRCRSAGPAK